MLAITKLKRILCRGIYEVLFSRLPNSMRPGGRFYRALRGWAVKNFIVSCGNDVNIEDHAQIPSRLTIGNHSGIGIRAVITGTTTIGENVMMGPDVAIYTHDHKHELNGLPFCLQGNEEERPVVIGSNVWIGTRCIILPGVHIGDNVVVGAGSVVTRDIPSGVVAAGNPARIVKELKHTGDARKNR